MKCENVSKHNKKLWQPRCSQGVLSRLYRGSNVVKGGKKILSKSCIQRYSIDQLVIHLNGKKHSRKQLVEVAMRPARASYWEEFEKIYSEEFEKILR